MKTYFFTPRSFLSLFPGSASILSIFPTQLWRWIVIYAISPPHTVITKKLWGNFSMSLCKVQIIKIIIITIICCMTPAYLYVVLSTAKGTLHVPFSFIIRHKNYYPNFTDEETKFKVSRYFRGKSSRTRILTWVCLLVFALSIGGYYIILLNTTNQWAIPF